MSALFDFPSLIVVLLLIICSSSYLRSLYPTIFNSDGNAAKRSGVKGVLWKASRIGERLSPYIGASCLIMALWVICK